MRADLYLHHTRIFKTRSQATQACQRGQVRIAGNSIKPSRVLKATEIMDVARGDLNMVLRVLDFPAARVGAPLVSQYLENLTPVANFQKAAEARRERIVTTPHVRAAKPDKKQLRMIRQWMEAQAVESTTAAAGE